MRNDNSFFVVGMITAGAMLVFGQVLSHVNSYKERDKPDLIAKTIQYADVNKDNRISHTEWAEVYRIVGKKYDDSSSIPVSKSFFNPGDLSYKDFKKYISYKKELEKKLNSSN